jgi:hypothetical protein
MSKIKLMALAVMMSVGAAHLASAASPETDQQKQRFAQAQANRSELSLHVSQDPATTNRWSETQSGVNIQSRAGFVGYH